MSKLKSFDPVAWHSELFYKHVTKIQIQFLTEDDLPLFTVEQKVKRLKPGYTVTLVIPEIGIELS